MKKEKTISLFATEKRIIAMNYNVDSNSLLTGSAGFKVSENQELLIKEKPIKTENCTLELKEDYEMLLLPTS